MTFAEAPLVLALHDGQHSRIHYALTLAATSAAVSRPVTLFVAGDAIAFLALGWKATKFDDLCKAARVATFAELKHTLIDLKVPIFACEQALWLAGMSEDCLDPALNVEVTGSLHLIQMAVPPATCIFI